MPAGPRRGQTFVVARQSVKARAPREGLFAAQSLGGQRSCQLADIEYLRDGDGDDDVNGNTRLCYVDGD